ncbi:MAG: hypothetical protein WD271_09890 [Acidimicrobiia bacterium]
MSARRSDAALLDDIREAGDVGAAIVSNGRAAFDADPVLRFASEAVIARIRDAASKLAEETTDAISEVPWREIRGMELEELQDILAANRAYAASFRLAGLEATAARRPAVRPPVSAALIASSVGRFIELAAG